MYYIIDQFVQFSSVTQSCLTLCDPMNHIMPSLSITNYQSSLKLTSIESVMPSSHLILCRPLLLLPSIFHSIRVFSNKLGLHTRWPKYWSFSYSNAPSSAYSGLISFRINWFFISLQSKGLSQESSPIPQFKSISSSVFSLLYGSVAHPYSTTQKTIEL